MIKNVSDERLAKAKFLLHPQPEEDEILSSWLLRICKAHDTDPGTFVHLHLPEWGHALWRRDFDIHVKPALIERLSHKSGFSTDTLYSLTLRSYEGCLFEQVRGFSTVNFIQPLCTHILINTNRAIRYCPLCMKEDGNPYFRKRWRVSFVTACTKHGCFLVDSCQQCGLPLTPKRWHPENGYLYCHSCGFDLISAVPEQIKQDSYGLKAIEDLQKIMATGWVLIEGRPVYSFLFFSVVRHLAKLTYFMGKNSRLLLHESMADEIEFYQGKPTYHLIEEIPLKSQYLIFSGIMNLMENYPIGMEKFCRLNGLGKTGLTVDLSPIPFWYTDLVSRFDKKRTGLKITVEEVANAVRYLKKRHKQVSKAMVRALLGNTLESRGRKDIDQYLNRFL